jgi:hypothetical protein
MARGTSRWGHNQLLGLRTCCRLRLAFSTWPPQVEELRCTERTTATVAKGIEHEAHALTTDVDRLEAENSRLFVGMRGLEADRDLAQVRGSSKLLAPFSLGLPFPLHRPRSPSPPATDPTCDFTPVPV